MGTTDCNCFRWCLWFLGFEGDTSDHLDLPQWYEPHIQAWSKAAMPCKYVVINKVNNRKRKSIF